MRSPRLEVGVVVFAVAAAALLAYGLTTLHLIPYYEPFWGLDLHNIFVFHHCDLSVGGLYGTPGQVCGDVSGRDFVYPPAMFWLMAWVRAFTFERAVDLWNIFMVGSMLAVGATWLVIDGRHRSGWRTVALSGMWVALLTQFPFVFALERGNNDVVPVIMWTTAAAVHVRGRPLQSGAFAGMAAAAKVYPAVALFIVVAGTLRRRMREAALVLLGAAAAGLAISGLWLGDTWRYVTEVLPAFAAMPHEPTSISHSIYSLSAQRWLVVAVGIALLGCWVVASWARLRESPAIVFAGGLAIATYFSSTSWDYNLITVYPLILLVVARGLEPGALAWRLAALGTMFAALAPRGVLSPVAQLLLQVLTLSVVALLVARERNETGSDDARLGTASNVG